MLKILLQGFTLKRIRSWLTLTAVACAMQVHLAWIKTPRNKGGLGHIKIPLLADVKKVSPRSTSLESVAYCSCTPLAETLHAALSSL
jgi:hypothetical protein